MADKPDFEYCEICDNIGWVWDDVAHAAGGSPHKYCYCVYGDLLVEKELAVKRKNEKQFKTCPTCNGSGKIKREK